MLLIWSHLHFLFFPEALTFTRITFWIVCGCFVKYGCVMYLLSYAQNVKDMYIDFCTVHAYWINTTGLGRLLGLVLCLPVLKAMVFLPLPLETFEELLCPHSSSMSLISLSLCCAHFKLVGHPHVHSLMWPEHSQIQGISEEGCANYSSDWLFYYLWNIFLMDYRKWEFCFSCSFQGTWVLGGFECYEIIRNCWVWSNAAAVHTFLPQLQLQLLHSLEILLQGPLWLERILWACCKIDRRSQLPWSERGSVCYLA